MAKRQDLDLEATIPYPPEVMDERTTRVLDTALFQYMARQLWEMRQLQEAERREGEVMQRTFEDVTTGTTYNIRKNEGVNFFIADIFNEGPNTAYVRVNHRMSEEITLWAGQGIVLNHEKAKKKLSWLRFRCESDEMATIRVIGQY